MPKSLTSESFKKLLAALSDNEAEAEKKYRNLREMLGRFFRLKGISDGDEAVDETIDRIVKKIEQETLIEDLRNFTFGVAKFVALEMVRRDQARARAADSFHLKNSPPDSFGERDLVEHLRGCFDELYPRERLLLVKYFEDLPPDELHENRIQLAKRESLTLNALRNRISRLRSRLEECLQKKK